MRRAKHKGILFSQEEFFTARPTAEGSLKNGFGLNLENKYIFTRCKCNERLFPIHGIWLIKIYKRIKPHYNAAV